MLKMRQIACADLVILNKVDLAGAEQTHQVRQWIDGMMSRVRIMEANYCNVPMEILLAVGRFDLTRALMPPSDLPSPDGDGFSSAPDGFDGTISLAGDTHAGHIFGTWTYESDRPFSLEALREMVRKELPGTIYRCKGIVYTAEEPERRVVLQCVGRRTNVELAGEWNDITPCTKIVAIGERDRFDPDDLQRRFEACRIEPDVNA
jgi:G3E family GTPase